MSELVPPRGCSAIRDPRTGAVMHTCRRGVPDPTHPAATDEQHCGACRVIAMTPQVIMAPSIPDPDPDPCGD